MSAGGTEWTVARANAALPGIRCALQEARTVLARLHDVHANLEDLGVVGGLDGAEARELEARRSALAADLHACLDPLARQGVQVKDVESGLVDFPARMGTAWVYLCWKDGEAAVAHWHSAEGGFAGRKAIPGLAT